MILTAEHRIMLTVCLHVWSNGGTILTAEHRIMLNVCLHVWSNGGMILTAEHSIMLTVCLHFQAMMDRERKDELPQMQVGFIDVICLPLYKVSLKYFSDHL